MKILITGGNGFIGSHVTRHFVKQGHEVCVATRNTYAGKMKNIQDIVRHITLLIGDLAEPDFARACASWPAEWVIHMAAETHVDKAIIDPLRFIRANVVGTANVLHAYTAGQHAPPARMLLYSTDEVFGSTPVGVQFDEQTPYNPSNAYSASKVAVEAIARSFVVTHDLPLIVVRPCNTYGPGQHPEKVIPKFVEQIRRGVPLTVYNDGRGTRDWLHVVDHASAVETLLRSGRVGESYNLAAGEVHTDLEIAQAVIETLAPDEGTSTFVPGRLGHDARYVMDGTKLHRLGWQPDVDFREGVRETILWNAQHPEWWAHDLIQGAALREPAYATS